MIFILFLMLFMLTVIAYVASNRIIIAPWVIVCGVFLISTFLAVIQKNYWRYEYHFISIFIIISALIVFGIGSLIAQRLFLSKKLNEHNLRISSERLSLITIKPTMIFLLILLVTLCALYNLYRNYLLGVANGGTGSIFSMVRQIRFAKLNQQQIGRIAGHCSIIVRVCATCSAFVLIRNSIFYWNKKNLLWFFLLIPIFWGFVLEFVSGGRMEFIRFTIFAVMIFFIGYLTKKKWNPINSIALILIGVGAIFLLLIVFWYVGLAKGSGTNWDFLSYISLYAGMSIPSLDEFLVTGRLESLLIGEHTLVPIYSTLKGWGFNVPLVNANYEIVSMPNGTSGNVYTALRRYIEDFGYVGMYIMMFLLGLIFSAAFFYLKTKKCMGFPIFLFSYFSYPIFMISIDEMFLMGVISMTTIYFCIYFSIFYYLIVYKNIQKEKGTDLLYKGGAYQ